MNIEKLSKVKSEIIQNLAYDFIKKISEGYSEYLVIEDEHFDDGELFINVLPKYNVEDFNNLDMYKLYLSDFERECNKFYNVIDYELCSRQFLVDYVFEESEEIKSEGDEKYYDKFCLYFRIIIDGSDYRLDYNV